MKTKIIAFVLILFGFQFTHGETVKGSGKVTTEERSLSVFTGIFSTCSANIILTLGDNQKIKIEAEDNIQQYIITSVSNNKLSVSSENNIYPTKAINIYITIKEIKNLELTGSGNISAENMLKSPSLKLKNIGSGSIKATIDTDDLEIQISGSGDIKLSGNAKETNIKINGSGKVKGKELTVFNCNLNLSGSGDCTIDVKNILNANLSGSGNVFVVKEPKSILGKVLGSGKVRVIS
jgi:hypothetical protein